MAVVNNPTQVILEQPVIEGVVDFFRKRNTAFARQKKEPCLPPFRKIGQINAGSSYSDVLGRGLLTAEGEIKRLLAGKHSNRLGPGTQGTLQVIQVFRRF